jgi:RHS repeat-associated protein
VPTPTPYYDYDGENKMVQAGGSEYVYDGDGQRVKKLVGSMTTIFVYDAARKLIAEYGGEQATANGTRYLTTDSLDSTRVVTDKDGGATSRHDYLPFGAEIGAGIGGRSTTQGYSQLDNIRQKFASNERDNETGLDYFRARYYASTQGRFTSPDQPFVDQYGSNPQSWNLYSYVRNNPLRLVDPTGHFAQDQNGKPNELDPNTTTNGPPCWPNCSLTPWENPYSQRDRYYGSLH